MRTLQKTEVAAVSGAGLLTSTLSTAVQAGSALTRGLVQAGTIVARPVVRGTVNVLKFLI
jgi:hypothetical protein